MDITISPARDHAVSDEEYVLINYFHSCNLINLHMQARTQKNIQGSAQPPISKAVGPGVPQKKAFA